MNCSRSKVISEKQKRLNDNHCFLYIVTNINCLLCKTLTDCLKVSVWGQFSLV